MNREKLLKIWYAELARFAPLKPNEEHTFEAFRSSPVVQAALVALELNGGSQAHDLVLLEENLKTCLELKSLPVGPRGIIYEALQKVQDMQRAV